MRLRAVCLAGLVLAICPVTGVAANRPPLARLSDAYDGNISSSGAAFRSDGSRFVTFSDAAGHEVALDTRTGTRSAVTLSPCLSGQPPAPEVSLVGPGSPHVFAPAGLSRGTLITFCFAGTFDPAPEQFRLIDLATRVSRLVTFSPPPNYGPFSDLTNPGTDGTHWADVFGGTPTERDHAFFNFTTGAVLEPAPVLAANEYEDLDSQQLTHRLCTPVTTADVEVPTPPSMESIGVSVVGVDRRWAVLEVTSYVTGGSGGSLTTSASLYAWRCGSPKPVLLGSLGPQGEQFGDGVVTWIDKHGRVNAADLARARHWTWPLAPIGPGGAKVGYAEALHTASRIYAEPQGTSLTTSSPRAVYTASLAGLRAATPKRSKSQ
ncbi:MAG: hypothetical protein QOH12_895 [Solirubrobacteraceae bacterium]|jgi:hypothetical protein|nr:hypothetical protein [Solirubrobacteraceae bacterium]